MKIHLFGASRAGITTSGMTLGYRISTATITSGRPSTYSWAAGYDDSCDGSRTLANRTGWLGRFACSVLALRGDLTVAEWLAAVLTKTARLGLH